MPFILPGPFFFPSLTFFAPRPALNSWTLLQGLMSSVVLTLPETAAQDTGGSSVLTLCLAPEAHSSTDFPEMCHLAEGVRRWGVLFT